MEIGDLTSAFADCLEQKFPELTTFWEGLIDVDGGGFYGEVDFDGVVHRDAKKGCILNSRILWFFSRTATNRRLSGETGGKDELMKYADQAYRILKSAFLDPEYGGVFWSVTAEGKPLETLKHTYNQAFAVYGLAAYYEASGNPEALELARRLMQVIEGRCRDEAGYLEAFSRDFGPASNEKLSENGVMADRTMNTLLHVMEAYTELHRVAPSEETADRLREILSLFRDKLYNPERGRLEVFFDLEYHSLIDLYSYGHDIEASWLIDRAVEVLGAEGTEYDLSELTEVLRKSVLKEAFDGHSLPAECERGKVLETRVWWVQCEAVVGFFNGYLKTGKREYAEAAAHIWWYIHNQVIGKAGGRFCWYPELEPDGTPIRKSIADEWTCPYHNGRMYIEICRKEGTEGSLAAAAEIFSNGRIFEEEKRKDTAEGGF